MNTFESPEGKRVLEDLKKKTTYDSTGVVYGIKIDPLTLAFDEGRRWMILYILKKLRKPEPRLKEAIHD